MKMHVPASHLLLLAASARADPLLRAHGGGGGEFPEVRKGIDAVTLEMQAFKQTIESLKAAVGTLQADLSDLKTCVEVEKTGGGLKAHVKEGCELVAHGGHTVHGAHTVHGGHTVHGPSTLHGPSTVKGHHTVHGGNLFLTNGLDGHACAPGGAGDLPACTGTGNLIVGFGARDVAAGDAHADLSGDHNVVVGRGHAVSSHGGIVSGVGHVVAAPHAAALAGQNNTVTGGAGAAAVGGTSNIAEGVHAVVLAGEQNQATGQSASVSGGRWNAARGQEASVSGGSSNSASGNQASVSGGLRNGAHRNQTTVSGGCRNSAIGDGASLSGGFGNTALGTFASILGGQRNKALARATSVSGGWERKVSVSFRTSPAREPCSRSGITMLPLDLDGTRFTPTEEATSAACQKRCIDHAECAYFNYYADGRCLLTDGEKGASIVPGVGGSDNPTLMSGSESCWASAMAEPCSTSGVWYMPMGQHVTSDSPADCRQQCIETDGCKYFNYIDDWGGTAACFITTGEDGAKEIPDQEPTSLSGSKFCHDDYVYKIPDPYDFGESFDPDPYEDYYYGYTDDYYYQSITEWPAAAPATNSWI